MTSVTVQNSPESTSSSPVLPPVEVFPSKNVLALPYKIKHQLRYFIHLSTLLQQYILLF